MDARLQSLFSSILGADLRAFGPDDGPGTVPGWDSATHLELILAIEAEYGIELSSQEIPQLTTIGRIAARVGLP